MSNFLSINKNFSRAYLSADISSGSTTMSVVGGSNKLPTTSGTFYAVIWDYLAYPDPADDPNTEIVLATWSSGTSYTITRGQDNTSAAAHSTGSKVSLNITAGWSTNERYILGSKVFYDNSAPTPGYFVWFNGATNQYEMHSGSSGSTTLPYGLFANRPVSPAVGDWYLATDIPQLYTCVSIGVWIVYPLAITGAMLTSLATIPSGAGIIPQVNLPHGLQVFAASGTFTAPTGVTKVYLSMIGGGGGGGGITASANGGAGGGGAGAWTNLIPYTVVPGNSYTVTIGAAGTGGANGSTNGGTGGTTSFDGTIQAVGGSGGVAGTLGNGGSGGAGTGYNASASVSTISIVGGGYTGTGGNGAKGEFHTSSTPYSGAGGGSPYGPGAAGQTTDNSAGIAGTVNTGAGGSGACGRTAPGGISYAGGNGGSGIVIVQW